MNILGTCYVYYVCYEYVQQWWVYIYNAGQDVVTAVQQMAVSDYTTIKCFVSSLYTEQIELFSIWSLDSMWRCKLDAGISQIDCVIRVSWNMLAIVDMYLPVTWKLNTRHHWISSSSEWQKFPPTFTSEYYWATAKENSSNFRTVISTSTGYPTLFRGVEVGVKWGEYVLSMLGNN